MYKIIKIDGFLNRVICKLKLVFLTPKPQLMKKAFLLAVFSLFTIINFYANTKVTSETNKHSNQLIASASPTDLTDERIKIRLGFEAAEIDHRQILLTIDERASYDVDWGFDAKFFQMFNDDMYWSLNNEKYVIQAFDTIMLDREIPLGIQSLNGGDIMIKIDSLENFTAEMEIYLLDKELNEMHNLSQGNYIANIPPGDYQNRYAIVFKAKQNDTEIIMEEPTDTFIPEGVPPIHSLAQTQDILILMNNQQHNITVINKHAINIDKIHLFNLQGQPVQSWANNLQEKHVSLPFNVVPGDYIVFLETENGNFSRKVSIN